MDSHDLFSLATDPGQYDSQQLHWEFETRASASRKFFEDYLRRELGDLTGKCVLDIGSGTGYLSDLFEKLGASAIEGVKPSRRSVKISREYYPAMRVIHSSFEKYEPREIFSVAVAVMVFEHIADVFAALRKIYALLSQNGVVLLIVGDETYVRRSQEAYNRVIEELSNGEIAVATKQQEGTRYDLIRPVGNYVRYAKEAGLTLVRQVPMVPTTDLMAREPWYRDFENIPICQLLVFRK